ncbi:MAG: N-acetyl-gamma-glutamyl-phosphate reductase [Ignavibacteriaceae bacterium]
MISVGIVGGSGYTGKKLIQFCSIHPFIEEFIVYGNSSAGQSLSSVLPEFDNIIHNSVIRSMDNLGMHDLYFIALPPGEALKVVPELISKGKKVIDLGGDYRLDSKEEYELWYGKKHTSPELLNSKIYGLADYQGKDYADVNLIANPGCYPTATLLSLIPFVDSFGDEIITVSTVAYSGTSGAGKTPKQELLMSEMDGNVSAYNLNKHRHQPEILQMLKTFEFNSPYSFSTHLLPIAIGIYATTSIHLKNNISEKEIVSKYKSFYSGTPFVRIREIPPQLNWVVNTNFCDINISIRDKVLIITSAIDNLIKGASGQAIQNMNILFGWDETLSLLNNGVKNVSVY